MTVALHYKKDGRTVVSSTAWPKPEEFAAGTPRAVIDAAAAKAALDEQLLSQQ